MSLKVNLGYRNAPAAISFLVDALGFEPDAVYTGATSDAIAHAELRWPGGGWVTLHSTEPGNNAVASLTARAAEAGGYPAFSVHLDTHDPESVLDRARKAGATIVQEMKTSGLGKGFIVSDPEGLYWSIGTPLPKLVRNEQGQWQPQL